jgi:hypothetical protein
MGRKVGIKNKNHIEYICPNCLKNYGCRKYEYNIHMNKLKPCKKKNNIPTENNEINSNNNINKSNSNNVLIHDQSSSDDNNSDDNKSIIHKLIQKMDLSIKQNNELKTDLLKLSVKQIPEINNNIKNLEKTIPANSNFEISNQLVNKIIEREKKIDELDRELNEIIGDDSKQIKNNIVIFDDTLTNNQIDNKFNEVEELENKALNLILNNQIIQFREPDNYINATQLCKSGGKKFHDWIRLDTTKNLISMLASKAGIPALDLIDSTKGGNHIGTWIHPDLAIQLAQWISSEFAIQVSLWIRELFTKGNVSINLKILKEKENIIKDCQRRIKILEDLTLKRHSRTKYSDSNVVYIITDKNIKKKRTEIDLFYHQEKILNFLPIQLNKLGNFLINFNLNNYI